MQDDSVRTAQNSLFTFSVALRRPGPDTSFHRPDKGPLSNIVKKMLQQGVQQFFVPFQGG